MPFVTISILKGKSPEYTKAVGDGINAAVIETMGFPKDDRYQVIHELESHCLQYQQREGDRVMMHLTMRGWRANKGPNKPFMQKQLKTLPSHQVLI